MTRTHRPAATLLLTLGVALAGLTACAEEEPVPKFAEEPKAAATPVEKEEKETAEEFIRRWAQAQNEMHKGDSSEYRDIAGSCEPCMATADRIDGIYKAGGFVKTDGMTVRSTELEAATKRAKTYEVVVDLAPTEFRESAQASEQSLPGGNSTYSVVLVKSAQDGWIFANYMKVPE